MKFLVTGCAGFIGSNICDRLLKDGHVVVGIDDFRSGYRENVPVHSNMTFIKGNINELNTVLFSPSLFDGIEVVIHCAANARIQPCVIDPRLAKENTDGTFELLEFMRSRGIKKIIFSSSSSIYGNNRIPFTEDMWPNCLNSYSLSKLMCENYINMYDRLYDINGICLRYFNVWGPREYLDGEWGTVIGKFFRQLLLENKPLTIVGSGSQRRDFTYIDDVVNANIQATKWVSFYESEVFNVGTEINYSIDEIANMVLDSLNLSRDFKVYLPSRSAESQETLADIHRTQAMLEWSPTVSIKERISDHRDYYKKLWSIK